jgi:hypothetical protein
MNLVTGQVLPSRRARQESLIVSPRLLDQYIWVTDKFRPTRAALSDSLMATT